MTKPIRVTAVSYLNTKPLLYGLLQSSLAEEITLSLDIPSECARKLKAGEVDMALTPVAILPELEEWHLVSDYCIGAVGAVKTVSIFAEQPLANLDHIFLDHHSRSSVALTKVLFDKYWKRNPLYLPASEGYIDQIKGRTGGVVIGDRTIGLSARFPYVYDLSEAWYALTGLPFVFAAWVSNRPLPVAFTSAFNQALQAGIQAIPKLKLLLPSPHPDFDLETYFTHYISYDLDAEKRKGLDLFLQYLNEYAPQHERGLTVF
ncbi:MAG: menaquinone biosynthesis protein [Saprospiraceae bacterium]